MKRLTTLSTLLALLNTVAFAEPVFMPQAASVLKAKQAEVGVSAQAGYQKSEIENNPGTTFINRVWHVPVWARYGVTETLEARLLIPFTHAVDSSEGLSSTRNDDSGLGNIQLGTKWNFKTARLPLAVGLDFDMPTANPANNPAALGWRYSNQVQQGFNTHLFFAGDSPLFCERFTAHGSIGYMNTGAYTTSGGGRFNPSDLMTFGTSLEMELKPWLKGLSAAGEMVGNTGLNHSKSGSTHNGNDMGTVLEVGPSLRYQTGPWRTHAGFLFDVGKSTFRAYNQRLMFGFSYLIGG